MAKPPFRVLRGLSLQTDGDKIRDFLRQNPAYDPDLVSNVYFGS